MTSFARVQILILVAVVLVAAASVRGAIYNIANGDVTALKNAINSANVNNQDDLILLPMSGIFTLSSVDHNTEGATALPKIGSDNGHVLTIAGNGSALLRAATAPSFRFLEIADGASLVIISVSFRNGNLVSDYGGGAIHNRGTLSLTSCVFSRNVVTGLTGADQNGGAGVGGAINSTGDLSIDSCSFVENSVTGGTATGSGNGGNGYGGALYLAGKSRITSSAFLDCSSHAGTAASGSGGTAYGGAMCVAASASVVDTTFSGNNAITAGAIVTLGGYGYSPVADVVRSTFIGNTATDGGVAYTSGGSAITAPGIMHFTDCTLSGNRAATAGVLDCFGVASFLNCTIAGNSTTKTDGWTTATVIGNVELENTILQGGVPGRDSFVGYSRGHNVSDDNSSDLSGPGDMRNTDPQLATSSPAANGGRTKTFALLPSSPAINYGTNNAPPRDQRGNFRTGRSDVGAYEYAGSLVGAAGAQRNESGQISVTAEVVYGHTYRLERKPSLSGTWGSVPGVPDFTAEDNDVESRADPNAANLASAFYRFVGLN